MKLLGVAILFMALAYSHALTCPEKCTPALCTGIDLSVCKYGTVLNVCGCCQVCAKGLGESCGGLWDRHAYCAKPLKCTNNNPKSLTGGICARA